MQVAQSHHAGHSLRTRWTQQSDRQLLQMRKQGASLRTMAKAFGLSRSVVTARALQLGVEIPTRPPAQPKAASVPRETRDPLPAGDPLTWGLITQGTCLQGNPYTPPQPVRSRMRKCGKEEGRS